MRPDVRETGEKKKIYAHLYIHMDKSVENIYKIFHSKYTWKNKYCIQLILSKHKFLFIYFIFHTYLLLI